MTGNSISLSCPTTPPPTLRQACLTFHKCSLNFFSSLSAWLRLAVFMLIDKHAYFIAYFMLIYTPATQGQIRTEVSTQCSCQSEQSGGYLKLFVPFCSNMMKVNEMLSQGNSGSFYPLPSIPPFRGSFRKHLKIIFWTKTVEIKTFSFMFFPFLFNVVHNVEDV